MSTKDPEDGLTDEQLAEQEAEQEAAADRGDVLNIDDNAENLAAVAAGKKVKSTATGDDEEEEEEEDAAAAAAGKSKSVPHSRFNEVNEKRIRAEERALMLEEENARLKGTTKAKAGETDDTNEKPFDVDANEREYLKAVMDGDEEKAFGIRKSINAELRRLAREEAETAAESRVSTRVNKDEFAVAVADTLKAYPFLDSADAKGANADAIEMVVAVRDKHIAAGKTPAQALKLAAAKVGPLYAPKAAEKEEVELTPEEKLAAKLKMEREERQAAALKRNAIDAGKQPASIAKAGTGARAQGAAPSDVGGLNEDEFSKLSKKEKSDLRGDTLG